MAATEVNNPIFPSLLFKLKRSGNPKVLLDERSVYGSYELFLQCFNDRGFGMEKIKFNPEIKETLDSLLLEFPGVTAGKMFGYPAYYVGKKLFACLYENGVGIKVPEDLAEELIKTEVVTYFQPLGRAKMKQWIQINRQKPDDYLKDKEIFKASIDMF